MDVIMNIVKAKPSQTEIVQHITHTTIHEIYPLYYPAEVVDFFITHHSEEKIAADINLTSRKLYHVLMDSSKALFILCSK